jgi:uncharacterized membrane protein YhaH (DUF805 family)
VRTVYWVWSMVVLVMVIVQIAFAGYGAFYGATKLDKDGSDITEKTFHHGFVFHSGFGYLVWLAGIVLLVLGLIAGVGRWRLGKHGVLALLLTFQLVLAWGGSGSPVFGAFHPVNAFVILGLTISIAWDGRQARKAESAGVVLAASLDPAPR